LTTNINITPRPLRVTTAPRLMLCRAVAISVLAVSLAGCSSPKAPPTPRADALWGELKPVVSVKELMKDMIDPVADNIFDAVSIKQTAAGTVEKSPKTDEDWEKIRIGGVSLAEGVYLLKIPRPFAPAGDLNNSTGPYAVELSPTAIRAKVERDPVEWNARIEALRNVGLEVIDVVKRKDAKEMWDASDNLDEACEACHKSYWYPGEDDKFYRELERKLKDLPMPSPPSRR
jgi:cytochrome c556